MGAGVAQQSLAQRSGAVKFIHHPLAQPNEEAIKHRAVQRLLVMKVVIEERLVYSGRSGYRIHAGARQTFLGKLGQRRLKDGVAAGFRLAAGAASGREDVFLALHN